MKPRERFDRILNFQQPDDRLPMLEWASWWHLTLDRWLQEGLPTQADPRQSNSLRQSFSFFGLDEIYCLSAPPIGSDCPRPVAHGRGILKSMDEYLKLRPLLYTESSIEQLCTAACQLKPRHNNGEIVIRLWLDGFFWYPRSLLGIEAHFYALYDQPDLIELINSDLVAFHQRTLNALLPILVPDMAGFAEDMSYNKGPMLSKNLFDQFISPCYRKLVPRLKDAGIKVFVDSDGQVHDLLPWLISSGIEGIYPLERQSGVDVSMIRARYPGFLMMGGFDKRVMHLGESAIRAEFERLLPVMRSGGYIPSVDHQTPPDVSLKDYQLYLACFREYAGKTIKA